MFVTYNRILFRKEIIINIIVVYLKCSNYIIVWKNPIYKNGIMPEVN